MHLFDRIGDEYEQIVVCHAPEVGLRAIIAVHSTVLGPALGGTRFYPYRSEDQAMEDVLRLARGMTYKSAVAGLDLGGGKAVILGDATRDKSEALLRAYGRFIETLSGRYITAEDVGTTQPDMDVIFQETPNVSGISGAFGGSGDPSAATAYGLWWAMKAVRRDLDSTEDLAGCRIVVCGVGKVGSHLVAHLVEEGAKVTVADVNDTAVARMVTQHAERGVTPVSVEEAHQVGCDIFSPCALGGTLNDTTIAQLNCRGVVGSANNQLATPEDGRRLADRGIVYAPDFVVNSGGVINIAEELAGGDRGYDKQRAYANVRGIFDTTLRVIDASRQRGVTTNEVAEDMAQERIAKEESGGGGGVRCFDGTARRRMRAVSSKQSTPGPDPLLGGVAPG
ncbi:MAG: valine dehydrogenase [Acidimicrobiaceae bacterium]|nr:valine dehydrogenase [Acidimicrobiaceae bacterium]